MNEWPTERQNATGIAVSTGVNSTRTFGIAYGSSFRPSVANRSPIVFELNIASAEFTITPPSEPGIQPGITARKLPPCPAASDCASEWLANATG